jgi:hypothetical protein
VPAQVRGEETVFPFDGAVVRPADFYYWNFVITPPIRLRTKSRSRWICPATTGARGTLKVDVRAVEDHRVQSRPPRRISPERHGGRTLEFDDQNAADGRAGVPAGVASNGANVLTVRGVLTNASQYSYFVVDRRHGGIPARSRGQRRPAQVRAGGPRRCPPPRSRIRSLLAMDEQGAADLGRRCERHCRTRRGQRRRRRTSVSR